MSLKKSEIQLQVKLEIQLIFKNLILNLFQSLKNLIGVKKKLYYTYIFIILFNLCLENFKSHFCLPTKLKIN
jgi:hypothetical protein